jgi:chemotaxis protein MotB
MAGKGGGAWKVAYADFVTAMMAFFMVMWITAQNQEVKEAIAEHFQDPFADLMGEHGDSHAPRHGSEQTHRAGPKDDQPKTRGKPRPVRVELAKGNETTTGTTIFFADDSAELDQAAKDKLAKLLPVLTGKPQKIEVRGHSSRRPLPAASPYKSFWELSYARCLATMQHLQEQGIAPERIRLSQAGVYEPEPSLPGHEPAQQSRVDVSLLDEVAQHFTAPKSAAAKPAAPKSHGEPAGDHDGHGAPPAHDPPADEHAVPAHSVTVPVAHN